jgi:hypothetical protein
MNATVSLLNAVVRGGNGKMGYLKTFANLRLALGVIALFCSVQTHAMVTDCVNSPGGKINQCSSHYSPPTRLVDSSPGAKALATPAHKVLQFNPPRTGGPLAESAPLLLFVGIVIAVLLVRAKSINGK